MLNISNNKDADFLKEGDFYSLRTLKTPGMGRLLARVLLVIGGISFLAMFLPWQQNIRGTGSLTAFHPKNRPQTVETAIAGRIINWNKREGEFVNFGDTILTLAEVKEKFFDPKLLERLAAQITAKESGLEAKRAKQEALENQVAALRQGRIMKLRQAENKLKQATLKLQSDSIGFEAEQVN